MIEEKTAGFGPKRKGPNLLINKYMKKEESFFQKVYNFSNEEEKSQLISNYDEKRQ